MLVFNKRDPLNLLEDNEQVEFRIPLRKKPESSSANPLLIFSPLEVNEKTKVNEISEILQVIDRKVAALKEFVVSLGDDYGELDERNRLDLDCRRVSEDVAATFDIVTLIMKKWLKEEHDRLKGEFVRFCQLFKSAFENLCLKYRGVPFRMSQPPGTLAAIKFEKAAFFTNRPNLYKNLDELFILHTEISGELLKEVCSSKPPSPLITLTSFHDDLKCFIFETIELGRIEKSPLGKADYLRKNVPDFRDLGLAVTEPLKQIVKREEPGSQKVCCLFASHRPKCLHCQRALCPVCEIEHFAKLQAEIVEMAELITLPPSSDPQMVPAPPVLIQLVENRLETEIRELEQQLSDIISGLDLEIVSQLRGERDRIVGKAQEEAETLFSDFKNKVVAPLKESSSIAATLETFVSKAKSSLYDCENRSLVALEKIRDSVYLRRSEICSLEQRMISTFSPLKKFALLFEVRPHLLEFDFSNQSVASLERSRFAELLIPTHIRCLEVPRNIDRAGVKRGLNRNDRFASYRQARFKFVIFQKKDRFGDLIRKPVGLTSIMSTAKQVFIAVVHSSDRISLIAPNGFVAQTFKVIAPVAEPVAPVVLSGEIVADETRCRLIFMMRIGVFSIEISDYSGQNPGTAICVVPEMSLRFGDRPCTGLAVSSYRRELYTSFGNTIEAYSLDDGRFLFNWTNPASDPLQLRCFQWVPDDANSSMYLVYTLSDGDILCRKKLFEMTTNGGDVIARQGWKLGRVSAISAVASDSFGNLIVCEQGNSRLQVFSSNTADSPCFITSVKGNTSEKDAFFKPSSVTVVGKTIFVADAEKNQIVVFSLP